MKKLLLVLLFIPSLLIAAPLYKVEIIVFSHTSAAGLNSETWPIPAVLPNMTNVQTLGAVPDADPQTYQALPESEFTLKRDDAALRKAKNYSVLVHVAWIQAGKSTRESPRIRIFGGPGYSANGQTVAEGVAPQYWAIDGFIRTSRPYTWQADANLVLTVPRSIIENLGVDLPQNEPVYQFVLTQSEHPKLKEIYYFDHPLFGMLLQITPVKAQ